MSQSLYGDRGALTRSGAVAMVFSLGARVRMSDVVRCRQALSFAGEGASVVFDEISRLFGSWRLSAPSSGFEGRRTR